MSIIMNFDLSDSTTQQFIIKQLYKLEDSQRIDFFKSLKEEFCLHCGSNNPSCQCSNHDYTN